FFFSFFFFSSRRRHTRFSRDWSSDVCSSDLASSTGVSSSSSASGSAVSSSSAGSVSTGTGWLVPCTAAHWPPGQFVSPPELIILTPATVPPSTTTTAATDSRAILPLPPPDGASSAAGSFGGLRRPRRGSGASWSPPVQPEPRKPVSASAQAGVGATEVGEPATLTSPGSGGRLGGSNRPVASAPNGSP